MRRELTVDEAAVLAAFRDRAAARLPWPTWREVSDATGVPVPEIYRAVAALAGAGLVGFQGGRSDAGAQSEAG